jgi:hypothetical protein
LISFDLRDDSLLDNTHKQATEDFTLQFIEESMMHPSFTLPHPKLIQSLAVLSSTVERESDSHIHHHHHLTAKSLLPYTLTFTTYTASSIAAPSSSKLVMIIGPSQATQSFLPTFLHYLHLSVPQYTWTHAQQDTTSTSSSRTVPNLICYQLQPIISTDTVTTIDMDTVTTAIRRISCANPSVDEESSEEDKKEDQLLFQSYIQSTHTTETSEHHYTRWLLFSSADLLQQPPNSSPSSNAADNIESNVDQNKRHPMERYLEYLSSFLLIDQCIYATHEYHPTARISFPETIENPLIINMLKIVITVSTWSTATRHHHDDPITHDKTIYIPSEACRYYAVYGSSTNNDHTVDSSAPNLFEIHPKYYLLLSSSSSSSNRHELLQTIPQAPSPQQVLESYLIKPSINPPPPPPVVEHHSSHVSAIEVDLNGEETSSRTFQQTLLEVANRISSTEAEEAQMDEVEKEDEEEGHIMVVDLDCRYAHQHGSLSHQQLSFVAEYFQTNFLDIFDYYTDNINQSTTGSQRPLRISRVQSFCELYDFSYNVSAQYLASSSKDLFLPYQMTSLKRKKWYAKYQFVIFSHLQYFHLIDDHEEHQDHPYDGYKPQPLIELIAKECMEMTIQGVIPMYFGLPLLPPSRSNNNNSSSSSGKASDSSKETSHDDNEKYHTNDRLFPSQLFHPEFVFVCNLLAVDHSDHQQHNKLSTPIELCRRQLREWHHNHTAFLTYQQSRSIFFDSDSIKRKKDEKVTRTNKNRTQIKYKEHLQRWYHLFYWHEDAISFPFFHDNQNGIRTKEKELESKSWFINVREQMRNLFRKPIIFQ